MRAALFPLLLLAVATAWADDEASFQEQVRPVLREYCLKCHSTEKQKGDLDLEVFGTVAEARRQPKIWQRVAEELADREMPPKSKPQPKPEELARLTGWTDQLLDAVAREHAGDPGPVVLRRLSNDEYTFTLRDLTGLETLDPAKEFPADGAAGEGFTNTGQALVMSPGLLAKYFAAGREVASHAVLLPDGIRFSAGTTRRDWTDEILGEIRSFYRQFAAAGGEQDVNLQGLHFRMNGGGQLPLEKYLEALRAERAALASGAKTLSGVAAERGLSPKYLALLSDALENHAEPSPLMDSLREQWRQGAPAAKLVAETSEWQKVLWKFNSAGSVGMVDGPTCWMEPVTPLAERHELRLKLPANGTCFLVATPLPGPHGAVTWERPRLVVKGRPDLPLAAVRETSGMEGEWGLDPSLFADNGVDLRTEAPAVLEIHIPPALAAECELVTSAKIESGVEAAFRVQLLAERPAPGLAGGPVLVADGSEARGRLERSMEEYRRLFPPALCYEKIVPTDAPVTLNLFYREDESLRRLMLDEAQQARLDRLWQELHYVDQDPLLQVDSLAQLIEFATQDANPKLFEPLRAPFQERAAVFRHWLQESEPAHFKALLELAARAYRHPLTEKESGDLRALYGRLRAEKLPHEEALRLTLARVFLSSAFLYRAETAGPAAEPVPVNDWELATRLSYFLWSSQPDDELRAAAAAGRLHEPAELKAQTARLLAGPRVRRLAIEFACTWLHLRDFDSLDEKSERLFPTFAALRGAMYEESIRFFTDLFRRGGSVLDLLDANYTFLNGPLAKHYGIPGVNGEEWRRVEGVRRFARGGLLTQATVLAKMSGASRTSPILRGNWVTEVLLGERIPRPPKDVPPLPAEEGADTLTVRQLTEKHTSDARCSGCHDRMDAYGFALENFDAIGRYRDQDSAGRPIDAHAKTLEGAMLDGADGLREYLLHERREAFLRQFCKKLLGYALGRSVQLSDGPLLTEMQQQLAQNGYRFETAVQAIVSSPQFREIRGREAKFDE